MTTATVRQPKDPPAEPAQPSSAGPASITVTDDRGRKLVIKKLGALDRMRVAMVLGKHEDIKTVALYGNLAASVQSIDGQLAHMANFLEFEHLVQVLDEDGFAAVIRGWTDAGWLAGPTTSADDHMAAVGNLPATPSSADERG